MLKNILIITFTVLTLAIVLIPPIGYFYSLSKLDNMPVKSTNIELTAEQLSTVWDSQEKPAKIDNIRDITPYWIYKWLFAAFSSDIFYSNSIDPYDNVSQMASEIAITHMRTSKVNTNRMLWWHTLHASLSIWLQRHWSPMEIAVTYNENSPN